MMSLQRLVLLNTSILTTHGTFSYEPLTLAQAQALIVEFQREGREIVSAIGHSATAALLTDLLAYPVAANRIEFRQTVDETALIFKLRGRPPEGKVLSRDELENLGYEFGRLTRLS